MSGTRVNWRSTRGLALCSAVVASLAAALLPNCTNDNAIVLSIRPPPAGTMSEYEVAVLDADKHMLVYQSGVLPVPAVAAGRDLAADPLKVGLKLGQVTDVIVRVRASRKDEKLAPAGVRPAAPTGEYFFARRVQVTGTIDVDGRLFDVPPDDDRDFDHFPDATRWPARNAAVGAAYGDRLDVLDCLDEAPAPGAATPSAGRFPADVNPFAKPTCGPFNNSCGPRIETCVDADGDGDPEDRDCDDADPKRFHGNPKPRNCCQCTDRASCAINHARIADQSTCQPARCDMSFDFDCSGIPTACFPDDDCDGYSPADPVLAARDCNDNDPNIYPGAGCDGSGVRIPPALRGRGTQTPSSLTLVFPSAPLAQSTNHLFVVLRQATDVTAACAQVWSRSLGLSDPARLNVLAYKFGAPASAQAIVAPSVGVMAMSVYTFSALPEAVCLVDADCADPAGPVDGGASSDASAEGGVLDDAGADGGASDPRKCYAFGGGIGLCGTDPSRLPKSAGCTAYTVLPDGGPSTVTVTLAPRP